MLSCVTSSTSEAQLVKKYNIGFSDKQTNVVNIDNDSCILK